MGKRKVKPYSFEARAIAKAQMDGKIDLKELWKAEEDKELDPTKVRGLAKRRDPGSPYSPHQWTRKKPL